MKKRRKEGGQALVEFIILIPIVLMFVWYLVHINLAINKSLVGQKAARSQLFLKLFNHRSGPMLAEFIQTHRSHFYVGVSSKVMQNDGRPEAPTEILGVGMNPALFKNVNDDPGEPAGNSPRQRVRVRTIFGICTHRKKTASGLSDFCATEHQ
ncbi:MAG: TadE/TadG family type IV pilus assembly protein [Bdellovibrionota bacterium]